MVVLLYNSKEDAFKEYRARMLKHELIKPDMQNLNTIKAIEGVNPKYAKHMFLRNRLIEQFIKNTGGGLDLMTQPVCPHCEKPCTWDMDGKAYCFSCNKSIPKDKVYTVAQYLASELKAIDEETLKLWVKGAEDDAIIR